MVTIHETELKEAIHLGIEKAREQGRPILVSEVRKAGAIEALCFFDSGRTDFFGERFYWRDPEGGFYIAGLGIAAQLSSDLAEGRFSYIGRSWNELIQGGIIVNPYKEAGLGPLMFGGFSFDPHKQKTALWSKYPDSLFHIPRFMLTVAGGEAFLTTNVVCTKHDGISLFKKVAGERESLLKNIGTRMDVEVPSLKEIKEIAAGEWKGTVMEAVTQLQEGPLKKVVLARELRLLFESEVESGAVLGRLELEQKASFIFSFESGGDSFIGASPERLIKKRGRSVRSACLAGSIQRGKTGNEDTMLGNQLLSDEKNLKEHQYVVDMIRDAMEKTCDSVVIPDQPQLMKVRDIQHLYTPVEGIAKESSSLLDIVERLHPTPALGGLPKEAAIAKIRELETLDRGLYAAPIGWMDYAGNGEFAVAIRSGLIQGKEASLFAGCGVVANSDAESEYLETGLKFRPMLSALGGIKE
ncbi:isochorismate synthase [Neobacillus piezotolerans]|uniref:isochorismate synthase n=1 Tax=Neobacillus piezotolerans TaxID=2259171 RepID=UPI001FEAC42D|nr:isochorismate synthase [Neobacillus piezotolerans]